jgi:hypothetical protein
MKSGFLDSGTEREGGREGEGRDRASRTAYRAEYGFAGEGW